MSEFHKIKTIDDDAKICFNYLEEHAVQILGRSCELKLMLEEFRETKILEGMARKQRKLILEYLDEVILELVPWSSFRVAKRRRFLRLRMLGRKRHEN